METKLPIGIDNYKKICQECFYADKTGLIKEIIDLPSESVTLYTRPRRFGKSLNMSMLNSFFTNLEDNKSLFLDKDIASYGNKYLSYINSYPVISFSLSTVIGKTKDEAIYKFKNIVSNLYKSFKDILFNSLSEEDQNKYSLVISNEAEDFIYTDTIYELSKYLYNFYNKGCVILIDEYDQPLQNAFDEGFYDDIHIFFKSMFSKTLKSNSYLEKGVIFGITEVAKGSLFSGLNNVLVNTILNNNDEEYFGFTEKDVKQLLSYYGKEKKYELVKKWYGGYIFSNKEIYNPWSILLFLKSNTLDLYWTNTGSNTILGHLIESNVSNINDFLPQLILNEVFIHNIDLSLSYTDINSSKDALISYLLSAGYLGIVTKVNIGQYSIRFPNEEIKQLFKKEITDRFIIEPNNFMLLNSMRNCIKNNNTIELESLLENYFLTSLSYYDFSNEKNYQILLLTLSAILFEDYIIKNKVITGTGRCDVIIYSKVQELGIAIEIKHSKSTLSKERLSNLANTALKQAKQNDYIELLNKQNQKHILIYGIGFSNKKVSIKSEIIK